MPDEGNLFPENFSATPDVIKRRCLSFSILASEGALAGLIIMYLYIAGREFHSSRSMIPFQKIDPLRTSFYLYPFFHSQDLILVKREYFSKYRSIHLSPIAL